jgi:hypothetical protein
VVSSCVEPSLKFPVTVSWTVSPEGALGLAGVIVSETSTGPDVVNVTELVMLPSVAVMVAVPVPTAFTAPVADTDATDEFEVVQFTVEVKF